jgi:hypothetical protein
VVVVVVGQETAPLLMEGVVTQYLDNPILEAAGVVGMAILLAMVVLA